MGPRAVILILVASLGISAGVGCTTTRPHNPAPPLPTTKPVVSSKPIIDFSKGAGGFPLAGDSLPSTAESLAASLTTGYKARVQVPEAVVPVIVAGQNYPQIDALLVDLSDGQIKPAYRPNQFKSAVTLTDALQVKYIQYVARPLRYVDGCTNLRIVAHDVKLGLLRGRGDTAALVMTDARDGHVQFDVRLEDIRTMLLTSAKNSGNRAGYRVSDVEVKLVSPDSRALACELRVNGFWLLLPTSFKITGRFDVDDQYNAHLSNISCTGEDVGGLIFAGFIDRAIRKYDGRIMPLASFPGGRMKIQDLHINVDDSLRLDVAFGSVSSR
jgi:hypothetical protein